MVRCGDYDRSAQDLLVWQRNLLFGGHLVTDVLVELALAFLFIWGITVGAIISLRHGKWISTVGFFVKLALLSIFLVLAAIYVVSGSSKGAMLLSLTWSPPIGG